MIHVSVVSHTCSTLDGQLLDRNVEGTNQKNWGCGYPCFLQGTKSGVLPALHFQHYMADVGSLLLSGKLAMSQGDKNVAQLHRLLPAAAGIEGRSFRSPGREESDDDGVRGRS